MLTLNFNEVIQLQVHYLAAAGCHATQIVVEKYSEYQIRAISKSMTPLKVLHFNLRYFWPNFYSLTLNFDEVIWLQIHAAAAADCYATQITVKKYSGYQIRAISKCITPLKIPYIDLRYFWPDFISLTLNFYEVIWFQKHSLAAADCYTAVSSSEKYREFEIGAIS